MKNIALQEKQILLPFQGLRALAFVGIFLSHTKVDVLSSSGLGAWGVSVFLILSGFLMITNYYHTDRIQNCSVRDNIKFSLKKLSALYPLHIVMMLSALQFEIKTIGNSAGGGIRSYIVLVAKVFFNITMTQSFVPRSRVYYSLNAVSWYLSVCLFSYFCFPWIFRYFEKNMNVRKANVLIPTLLVLQIILCWLSSKINFSISDGFTRWFVYNFPVMRMIEFVFGAALGYLYWMIGVNNCDENIQNKKRYVSGRIADAVLLLDGILLIVALIIFSAVNPQDSSMNHPELWWRSSCLFTLLNGILIFIMAFDKGVICRLASNRALVFIGGISSNAFLIHQMVIRRYVNMLDKFIEIDNFLLRAACNIGVPFLVTVAACMIWGSTYQLVKLKFQNNRS